MVHTYPVHKLQHGTLLRLFGCEKVLDALVYFVCKTWQLNRRQEDFYSIILCVVSMIPHLTLGILCGQGCSAKKKSVGTRRIKIHTFQVSA